MHLLKLGIFPELGEYGEFTRWWHKGMEIDIMGVRENALLVGECKWKDGVDGARVLKELKDKVRGIDWKGKIEYAIFARSFSSKPSEAYPYNLIDIKKKLLRD